MTRPGRTTVRARTAVAAVSLPAACGAGGDDVAAESPDEAVASTKTGLCALACLGDDLIASDGAADGGRATETELRDLWLQLLELALD